MHAANSDNGEAFEKILVARGRGKSAKIWNELEEFKGSSYVKLQTMMFQALKQKCWINQNDSPV